jgi:hypothetical protein
MVGEAWLWLYESGTYMKFTPPVPGCSPDTRMDLVIDFNNESG